MQYNLIKNSSSNVKILLVLIIYLVIGNSVYSKMQTSKFDSLINIGINQIYNIKLSDAELTFNKLDKEYPNHPAGKFFDAMIIWWKIMLDRDNDKLDDLFEDKIENVIDFCDDLLDEDSRNVDAIFFKGGSLGFRGRLNSLRKNWFDAALDGKDALPLVYEAFEIDSTNEDVKLGFGIYNYYAEAIPEKYPFIQPAMIFFPSGDKKLGIKQLEAAAENSKYAKIESRFFLMTLYYQFEQNYSRALEYAKQLNSEFTENPIFEKFLGRIYIKKGNYKKAALVFKSLINKCEINQIGYSKLLLREASYYVGVNYLEMNKIDSSQASFETCEKISQEIDSDEESGFRINSILYLGKIANRIGNIKLADYYYNQLLELREYSNSHKKAEKYFDKKKASN